MLTVKTIPASKNPLGGVITTRIDCNTEQTMIDLKAETIRVRSNGFCDHDMTLMFTESDICSTEGTVSPTGRILMNTRELIECSMDTVSIASGDVLFVVDSDVLNGTIQYLYEVIDSPTLRFSEAHGDFVNNNRYLYSKEYDVCIRVSTDKYQDHYHVVREIFTTRTHDKIERLQSFKYKYLVDKETIRHHQKPQPYGTGSDVVKLRGKL